MGIWEGILREKLEKKKGRDLFLQTGKKCDMFLELQQQIMFRGRAYENIFIQ